MAELTADLYWVETKRTEAELIVVTRIGDEAELVLDDGTKLRFPVAVLANGGETPVGTVEMVGVWIRVVVPEKCVLTLRHRELLEKLDYRQSDSEAA